MFFNSRIFSFVLFFLLAFSGCFFKNHNLLKNTRKAAENNVVENNYSRIYNCSNPYCFYKHFTGKLKSGKSINLNLERFENKISGNYFYQNSDENYTFEGDIDISNKFVINTYNSIGISTETISGTILNDSTLKLIIKIQKTESKEEVILNEDYTESLEFYRFKKERTIYLIENDSSMFCSIDFNYLQPAENYLIETKTIIDKSFFGDKLLNHNSSNKLDTLISEIVNDYKKLNTGKNFDTELSPLYTWNYMSDMKIIYNNNNILSYAIYNYEFTGGAHGSSLTILKNIDIKTQNEILLEDIFIENYENKLLEKILQSLVMKFNVNTFVDLNEYLFDYESVTITNNFYLDSSGICFVYNQYEIAPYSSGQIYAYIDYSDISDILKNNFALINN